MFGFFLAFVAGFFKSFSSAFKPKTSTYQSKESHVPFDGYFAAEEMLAEENDAYIPFSDEVEDDYAYDDYEAENDNAEMVECYEDYSYEDYSDEANDIDNTDDTYYY